MFLKLDGIHMRHQYKKELAFRQIIPAWEHEVHLCLLSAFFSKYGMLPALSTNKESNSNKGQKMGVHPQIIQF